MMCWFPYAVSSLAETAGYSPTNQVTYLESPSHENIDYIQISYVLFAIPTIMTKTSVCTDPILYFWLNTQFRRALVSITGLGREGGSHSHMVSLTSHHTRQNINKSRKYSASKTIAEWTSIADTSQHVGGGCMEDEMELISNPIYMGSQVS